MIKSVMTIFIVITLFACDDNYKEKQKLSLKDEAPVAEGININGKYTDSGKVVTNLITPKLWDFSNLEFPYQEFPEGIEVHFWDEDGKMSTVTSEYAIRFENTGIVDLRDNVVIVTADSTILKAQQLYWDQKNKWVFTDRPYQMKLKDGSFNNGSRFDSSEDFSTFLSRKNEGVQIVDSKDLNNTNGK